MPKWRPIEQRGDLVNDKCKKYASDVMFRMSRYDLKCNWTRVWSTGLQGKVSRHDERLTLVHVVLYQWTFWYVEKLLETESMRKITNTSLYMGTKFATHTRPCDNSCQTPMTSSSNYLNTGQGCKTSGHSKLSATKWGNIKPSHSGFLHYLLLQHD